MAEILAAPIRAPVITALLLSIAATRLPSITPPVLLVKDQVPAALATKLPAASRVIEYPVKVLPEVRVCADTTAPDPLATVSTRIAVAAPADNVIVPEVTEVRPIDVNCNVRSPIKPAIFRLVKVAKPFTSVAAVTVPASVPKPVIISAVTFIPAWAIGRLPASCNCIAGC